MRFWYFSAILWVVCQALPSKKQYSVAPELLPGLSEIEDKSTIPEMYAGHMPLAQSNSDDKDEIDYFFWKFSRPDKVLNTLIIWLNGGPGCSSMDGALVENGPFRVNKDLKLVVNEGSWHTRADMLYVDQPVNTGFSVSNSKEKKYDEDLTLTTQHFMDFLESYFKVFPDDQFKDLIIAGESYSGQYVPFLAEAIQKRNAETSDDLAKYNLRGILVGNGWMDPDTQSLAYLPFALSKGLIDQNNPHFSTLLRQQEKCQDRIISRNPNEHQPFQYEECENILQSILTATRDVSADTPSNQVCMNIYSYNLRDSYPACGSNWPDEVLHVPGFFDRPGILEALNLDPSKVPQWKECNLEVYYHLKNRKAVPSVRKLPALLDSGLKVILYNGEMDLLCNERGVLDMIDKLQWGGAKGFSSKTKEYDWNYRDFETNTDHIAGNVLHDRNLTYISVHNASHMVPNDKSLYSRGVVDIYLDDIFLEELHGKDVLVTTSEKDMDDFDNSKLGVLGITDGKPSEEEELEEEFDQYVDELEEGESESGLLDDDKEDETVGATDQNDDKNKGGEDKPNENPDKEKEEQDRQRKRRKGTFKIFGITILVVLTLGSFVFYIYIRKHTNKTRAILIDPSRRQHDSQNKRVSWADDLEHGYDFETDQSQPRSGQSAPKKNGSYTRVPNTELDESFELENL
ncbi:hypothetical protein ZYGR_0I02530 [Zygosaccharomyces rouxii]|uniref:Pheromone-processing carboxypeptidase KEX1 n=2 Tax=Zygosaccharomyces rouxii TaxID=4956 RepID=KEX1_ZYGRC|nr:uncharacterized protein ZYRO0C06006g [Zygosaccharomyces rouxii]C5DT72.1 RecName: Full=Pheromone-processing carboxypeptidase KEX1; AltName: Full=Carboxypeptidase D; Flags: Precursor [Zygosaccharomyces rouxii CBS 732]KAH9201835.1 pheromone-processing carboxypeptidase KEX1 [Zygosaccharomyces rouxii]GAV47957.1 hypothetical protein ZYGR_0I02530 [Zygosaccharomyces rouxii]CAR26983.1 ZYRO0C06006p [Zygosaccharomyces rouxii]